MSTAKEIAQRLMRAAGGGVFVGFEEFAEEIGDYVAARAPLDSPGFTGTPRASGILAVGGNRSGGGDWSGLLVGGGRTAEGGVGTLLANDGHANWLRAQTTVNGNPTELVIYGAAFQGQATAAAGGDTITRNSGSAFDAAWVGKLFYLSNTFFTITAVQDADTLTVAAAPAGAAVPFASTISGTFHVFETTCAGICDTNGTTVRRVSGQPFIPFGTSIRIGGVDYTIASWQSGDQITLTASAGVQVGVPYLTRVNINGQIATLRLQKLLGSDEENLTIAARHNEYLIAAFRSGSGQDWPIRVAAGYTGPGAPQHLAGFHAGNGQNGYVVLGGYENAEALRAIRSAGAVNRVDVLGASTGNGPSLRSRGADTNINLGFDAKGTGAHVFTNNNFGSVAFRATAPAGATGYLQADASASAVPALSAQGSAADVDILLAPKGAGRVRVGTYSAGTTRAYSGTIEIKDAAGNTRHLMVAS